MRYSAVLGPDDVLGEKPFTDAENTMREVGVMGRMLIHERERARQWAAAEPRRHIIREHDAEGHRHLIVVPDTGRLLETETLTAVGFFGSPRDDVDHEVLFALEEELVEGMGAYGEAGLLSYYDVELVKGEYGNLILFATPDVPPEWHRDEVHRRAIELSPGHYHHVRLHKGTIPGRLLDDGEIGVERTKYFDFDTGDGTWFGLREFV
ncbi:MAG TPA: hypothetical protein VFW80_12635 [Gaiellaceae bacterium]|nr:hypothetical protein [Gaiellaceae bacterium]